MNLLCCAFHGTKNAQLNGEKTSEIVVLAVVHGELKGRTLLPGGIYIYTHSYRCRAYKGRIL
jgi:hypothetical protein